MTAIYKYNNWEIIFDIKFDKLIFATKRSSRMSFLQNRISSISFHSFQDSTSICKFPGTKPA